MQGLTETEQQVYNSQIIIELYREYIRVLYAVDELQDDAMSMTGFAYYYRLRTYSLSML